jgi:UDP-N-acetylglucosamine acyltransferase
VLREYVTVNRGTAATGKTTVGRDCLIMAYSHVAHDCDIGDKVIIANGVQMGGHVTIGSCSVISGMTGIHQFTTIGPGCFVGGGLRVDRDIPPFSKALGEPLAWAGVNEIGLEKMGFGDEARKELKEFYRRFYLGNIESVQPVVISGQGDLSPLMAILKDFFSRKSRALIAKRDPAFPV